MTEANQRFPLWGFDGSLEGEEARLQGRLPFFLAPPDRRVFAARHADWSWHSQQNLSSFGSQTEAAHYGTRLPLDRDVSIAPGELVVLYGPCFIDDLQTVAPEVAVNLDKLPATPCGFRADPMSVEAYTGVSRTLSKRAKAVFDNEIRITRGFSLSSKANSALNVLCNAGSTPERDEIIRTLLAKRIKIDPDGYRRSLKLGAQRLKTTADALEADVSRHLRLLIESPASPARRQRNSDVLAGRGAGKRGHHLSRVSVTDLTFEHPNESGRAQLPSDAYAELERKVVVLESELREPAPPSYETSAGLLAEANRLHDLERAARALREEYLRRAASAGKG